MISPENTGLLEEDYEAKDPLSPLGKHAYAELELIREKGDIDNMPVVTEYSQLIINLVNAFGFSKDTNKAYVAKTIAETVEYLCMGRTLLPIYGDDKEWIDISAVIGNECYQNSRNSHIFKNSKGACVFNNAMIWKTDKGETWSGIAYTNEGKRVGSSQGIISFPFEPKAFLVDVDEEVNDEGKTILIIKDYEQVKEALEYYVKYDYNKVEVNE